jgi:HD-like signal output (HDOD) protein
MEAAQPARDKNVAAIVAKVSSSRGFPALSDSISRVLLLSGKPNASASELSQLILQDYGLTTKTLKVVNASFYGMGRHKVSTISRAVVLLGFQTIKDIATGMIVFEHFFGHSKMTGDMLDILTKSLMSAVQARELSVMAGYATPEEAFICALLYRLGKMVVAIHCPDEHKAICRLLKEGRTEYEAAQEVLGASLPDVGCAVAQEWKLPVSVWQSMDGGNGSAQNDPGKEFLRALSRLSNACVDKLCSHESSGWQEVLGPLQKMVPLSEEGFLGLMKKSAETAHAISPLMTGSLQRMGFKERLRGLKGGGEVVREAAEAEEPEEDAPVREAAPGSQSTLVEMMADVTQALTGDCSLNELYLMIVETLYRGLGFERVVLSVLTTDRGWIEGRYGLGADINEFIAAFRFPFGREGLMSRAVQANNDVVVDFGDVEDEPFKQRLGRYLAGCTLFIYPLVVRQKPIGCLFAQRKSSGRPPGSEELQGLAILRNCGLLAIERASSRRP